MILQEILFGCRQIRVLNTLAGSKKEFQFQVFYIYIHLIHNLTNEVMLVKPISGEIIRYFSRRFRLRSPSSMGRVRQEPIRNQSWDISEETEASNIN